MFIQNINESYIAPSRCSSCQVVFGGLNSIKSHIQTAHCEVFHKCPSCPMAFKSSPSAQSHISTQHPTLTGGQAKYVHCFYQNMGKILTNVQKKYLQRNFLKNYNQVFETDS